MSLMRAAVYRQFHGPIAVEEVARPTAPSGGVVLKVRATGVCRSDWHGWVGHDGDVVAHGLPFIPGHELAGEVAEVGPGVERFQLGDRVAVPFILSCGACVECGRGRPTICADQQQPGFTTLGSFAEYIAVPRADRNLCHIPAGVSFKAAAALGCRMTTAYRAVVQQGRLQPTDFLAVFGCGGVGLSAIMIAKAHGAAAIIAVDTNKASLEVARSLGATAVVDAGLGSEHVRQQVRDLTEGRLADVTVDAAGFRETCENAVWCARRGGRVVQVGLPLAEAPSIPMARVAGWELEVVGSHGIDASAMPDILRMVAEGQLDPERLIGQEVTLEQGAAALMEMDSASPVGMTMITSFERPNP
eukprot:EG_transcript_8525